MSIKVQSEIGMKNPNTNLKVIKLWLINTSFFKVCKHSGLWGAFWLDLAHEWWFVAK